ncbi:HNH endonuclease [Microbacterium deminutum]|uniref:HNH endonuclease signature motif containing protein n=1 Tax=Microbacterium deminutum TaxID=344164 RepID=A0ABN2QBA1_9MICO
MNNPLAVLEEAVGELHAAWRGVSGDDLRAVKDLERSRLIAVNTALSVVSRIADSLHADLAAEIARESRPELGPDGLSKQQGFRNPTALIAATKGSSTGDAVRLVRVGEATAPRTTLTGEALPPRHPHVADALKTGRIGMPAASVIITMLDRVALRADQAACQRAEETLVGQAVGLSLDQLAKLIARAEAHLDPDGLEPRERDARAERSLHIFERDGMIHLNAKLDAETGAPVKIAIEALVTADFRAALEAQKTTNDPDADRRSVPQRQADVLALMARHVLDCTHDHLPLGGATLVVRMSLDDLSSGAGYATIDGINRPVTVATARRMAAGGGVIPCVLGERGEILDWGRRKRLFSKAQRLALVERDGGCAMCGLPPGMTRAHHLSWWQRDHGGTDLSNGVLLCESCHHRIHDNGWEIRIDDASTRSRVWFIPPPHVDPDRAPRLGGRARFDYATAA